jgi:hypothetical protein
VATWTTDELTRVGAAQELKIAPVRRDGTLRKPTTIWVVRAGDDVYVRAAYGPSTGWHRVARTSRAARIWAGGIEKDVKIEDADDGVLGPVDAAYREKYRRYAGPVLDSVINPEARASTLRLVPRA